MKFRHVAGNTGIPHAWDNMLSAAARPCVYSRLATMDCRIWRMLPGSRITSHALSGGSADRFGPVEVALQILGRHSSSPMVDERLQMGVQGVHPSQAQGSCHGFAQRIRTVLLPLPRGPAGEDEVRRGGLPDRPGKARPVVGAQNLSPSQAAEQRFRHVVAIAQNLFPFRSVAVHGGECDATAELTVKRHCN